MISIIIMMAMVMMVMMMIVTIMNRKWVINTTQFSDKVAFFCTFDDDF